MHRGQILLTATNRQEHKSVKTLLRFNSAVQCSAVWGTQHRELTTGLSQIVKGCLVLATQMSDAVRPSFAHKADITGVKSRNLREVKTGWRRGSKWHKSYTEQLHVKWVLLKITIHAAAASCLRELPSCVVAVKKKKKKKNLHVHNVQKFTFWKWSFELMFAGSAEHT